MQHERSINLIPSSLPFALLTDQSDPNNCRFLVILCAFMFETNCDYTHAKSKQENNTPKCRASCIEHVIMRHKLTTSWERQFHSYSGTHTHTHGHRCGGPSHIEFIKLNRMDCVHCILFAAITRQTGDGRTPFSAVMHCVHYWPKSHWSMDIQSDWNQVGWTSESLWPLLKWTTESSDITTHKAHTHTK